MSCGSFCGELVLLGTGDRKSENKVTYETFFSPFPLLHILHSESKSFAKYYLVRGYFISNKAAWLSLPYRSRFSIGNSPRLLGVN